MEPEPAAAVAVPVLPRAVRFAGALVVVDAILMMAAAVPVLDSKHIEPGAVTGTVLGIVIRFSLGMSIWQGSQRAANVVLWLTPLALLKGVFTPSASRSFELLGTVCFVASMLLLMIGDAGALRFKVGVGAYVVHLLLVGAIMVGLL